MRIISSLLLVLSVVVPSSAQDLEAALEQSHGLVEQHRYREVVELLSAFNDVDEPEARYAVAAETGRALYHLGDYPAANTRFREAVTLRPQRTETALFFMATSYLVGDRNQAYTVFRELLRSGATDLYLAVTLPGERAFLSDPTVWEIRDEHAVDLDVDLDTGAVLGVALGQPRSRVESTLGTGSGADGTALTARAGPYLTWAFGFDEAGRLSHFMLHSEHLVRYTPYRLRLGRDLDWRATPEVAVRVLGTPTETAGGGGGFVSMEWRSESVRLVLEFAPYRFPVPPQITAEEPTLAVVRIEAETDDTP